MLALIALFTCFVFVCGFISGKYEKQEVKYEILEEKEKTILTLQELLDNEIYLSDAEYKALVTAISYLEEEG